MTKTLICCDTCAPAQVDSSTSVDLPSSLASDHCPCWPPISPLSPFQSLNTKTNINLLIPAWPLQQPPDPIPIVLTIILTLLGLLHRHTHLGTSRKPGPKSGHPGIRTKPSKSKNFHLTIFWALTMTISHYWDGGEGCSKQPWFGTEAAFDALALTELMQAKPHGKALQQGSGPWDVKRHISEITPVQKRSLKRAYRRSINSGCAWYRGRCLLPDQFPIELRKPIVSSTKPHIKHPTAKRTFAPKYRAQIGHVNVGGIATARLQEVKTWALEAEIDVLILLKRAGVFLLSGLTTCGITCIRDPIRIALTAYFF